MKHYKTNNYSVVLTGRITSLARPSARPSVPYVLLTRKRCKNKIGVNASPWQPVR